VTQAGPFPELLLGQSLGVSEALQTIWLKWHGPVAFGEQDLG
jgi:hypothetical protein